MADFSLNLALTKWPRHSLHARATADKGQPLNAVLAQLTGFVDVIKSGELDIEFLRDNVGAYLAEAFASSETHQFSKVFGDDTPLGTEWRLYIDGITPLEIKRQSESDLLSDDVDRTDPEQVTKYVFMRGETGDALTRMVRLDEEMGLLADAPAR